MAKHNCPSVIAILPILYTVRMAERSKALRSGRSPLLWAWVRIPLLTKLFGRFTFGRQPFLLVDTASKWQLVIQIAEWRSGSVLGP